MPHAVRTARARARAQLTDEILAVATRQLAATGPAGLSLRAVARELGLASSALYRYFPSRDSLLTALIHATYRDMGEAAESAERAVPRPHLASRWLATVEAVHRWALANPHRYALAYGTPVPGYRPPELTMEGAGRTGVLVLAVLRDAHRAGLLDDAALTAAPMPPHLPEEVAALRDLAGRVGDLPDHAVSLGVSAWTHLFGLVGFDVFGVYDGVFRNRDGFVRHAARQYAALLGLTDRDRLTDRVRHDDRDRPTDHPREETPAPVPEESP